MQTFQQQKATVCSVKLKLHYQRDYASTVLRQLKVKALQKSSQIYNRCIDNRAGLYLEILLQRYMQCFFVFYGLIYTTDCNKKVNIMNSLKQSVSKLWLARMYCRKLMAYRLVFSRQQQTGPCNCKHKSMPKAHFPQKLKYQYFYNQDFF